MKILLFTEGTILMHAAVAACRRSDIVQQVKDKAPAVHDYSSYVPIGNARNKIAGWVRHGASVSYLTSRTKRQEVREIREVLKRHKFPQGTLLHRKKGESYADVANRVKPDVLIEDDCESIGGAKEMTIREVEQKMKLRMRSIVVKEFGGIDHLPGQLSRLRTHSQRKKF